jgi:uncharacterized protein (TIGR02117 family)
MNRLVALCLLFTAGCVGPIKSLYPPKPGEPTNTVYVVNHAGWHTGIAVAKADIPSHLWPGKNDYPGVLYLEVGWGDDDGYRKELTTGIVIKAIVWSERTVLLVDAFTNSITENFDDPEFEIFEVKLSQRGFVRLCEHIDRTYALDAKGRVIPLGEDWYQGRGRYCLFNTCNTWVAKGLRAAGCPITPFYCFQKGPLLYQVGKFGKKIHGPIVKPEVHGPVTRAESPRGKQMREK